MSALPKPPEDISYANDIGTRWKVITEEFLGGKSVTYEVGQVETIITHGLDDLRNNLLPKEFDWQYDLDVAGLLHRSHLIWMENVSSQLSKYSDYWKHSALNMREFGMRLGQEGIKYSFLAHGSIGLASFSALNNASLKYSAIVGIFGAIVGLLFLTLGCAVIIETAPYAASHIENRLLETLTYRKNRGLVRVLKKKINPKFSIANRLIYGSICWLIFYALVAFIFFVQPP